MADSRSRFSHGRSEVWERPAVKRAIARDARLIARRLRELRAARGLTQEAAAERAGIHAKYLVRVESGRANPSVAILSALALSYGVETQELFAEPSPSPVQDAERRGQKRTTRA